MFVCEYTYIYIFHIQTLNVIFFLIGKELRQHCRPVVLLLTLCWYFLTYCVYDLQIAL